MQVVSGGKSLWRYTLLFTSLQLWGRPLASTSSPPLPAPKLDIYLRSKSSVVLVCRAPEGHQGVNFMLYRTTEKVDSKELQSGAEEVTFTVRVKEGDSVQLFCCLYKDQDGHYSVFSPYLQLEHMRDALPVPTLVVQQQTDVWHLLCTGSAAYPDAVFSLYVADVELPVATHRATLLHHQAIFPVPVQDTPVAIYQCQYDVLLGKKWKSSERSLSLPITKGIPPPSSTDLSGVDWPLVLGSFSVVVLIICAVSLLVVVAHRKVKAAAEKKKKRQEAQFWTQVHAKDHAVDLTLRRTSFPSQEWASADTTTETAHGSPLWNSLSTFTTPIPAIH
ncbi:uncharacterized protein LOC117935482 isoform X1 [Etheostoma cragini]|uniref:uncharacterized protein LOC117935482 isoform X1 n=2 Tax=Etheostoma cragini TaxID=417921 RepID=UPI00155DE1D7|nr:uncharacterized protein LOC117935482 isoform X1 [Etheostoma cragini]